MPLQTITPGMLENKGVQVLPDVPGLPAAQMKEKFEEVVRDVVLPVVNHNALHSYSKDEVNGQIDAAVLQAGAADMTKAEYDPQRSVQAAGGIPAYTEQAMNVAIAAAGETWWPYTHSKAGTVHSLMPAGGGGNNIKFTASGRFGAGDTFLVNGEEAAARLQDGMPLYDGFFVAGAAVLCVLSDSEGSRTLTFYGTGVETITAEDGNSTAVKHADGRLVCTKLVSVTTVVSIAWEGIYLSPSFALGNWAVPFVGTPAVNIVLNNTASVLAVTFYTPPTAQSAGMARLYSHGSQVSRTYTVALTATGRWK